MELMGASVVTEVDGNGSHALLDATTARRVTSAGRRSKFASRNWPPRRTPPVLAP